MMLSSETMKIILQQLISDMSYNDNIIKMLEKKGYTRNIHISKPLFLKPIKTFSKTGGYFVI